MHVGLDLPLRLLLFVLHGVVDGSGDLGPRRSSSALVTTEAARTRCTMASSSSAVEDTEMYIFISFSCGPHIEKFLNETLHLCNMRVKSYGKKNQKRFWFIFCRILWL